MEISVKWFEGKYPSFNVAISSQKGKEPFLEVKGCRIANGKNGEFVAPPSTKGNNDKYWNHAYFSPDFAAVLLGKAKEAMPATKHEPAPSAAPAAKGNFDSFDDLPF